MAVASHKVGEVAERLEVSPGTIRNWIEKGYISAARLPSGHRRVPDSELQRLIAQLFEIGAPVEEAAAGMVHVRPLPSDEEWGP
jgi:excisionase family DNA binding protein